MKINFDFRKFYLLVFIFSLGTIAAGVFVQYYYQYEPCPLCIIQRYGFLILSIIALIGLIFPKRFIAVFLSIIAIIGVSIATYQLHMQLFPTPNLSCSNFDLNYLLDNYTISQILPKLFKGTGDCQEIHLFIFLPLPAWSLISYLIIMIGNIWAFKKIKTS